MSYDETILTPLVKVYGYNYTKYSCSISAVFLPFHLYNQNTVIDLLDVLPKVAPRCMFFFNSTMGMLTFLFTINNYMFTDFHFQLFPLKKNISKVFYFQIIHYCHLGETFGKLFTLDLTKRFYIQIYIPFQRNP